MLIAAVLGVALAVFSPTSAPAPIPVLLDTDLGSDVDDAYALVCAVLHPSLEVVAITTAHDPNGQRARLVTRLLRATGREDVPVFVGRSSPQSPHITLEPWAEGVEGFDPPAESAPEAIVRIAGEYGGRLTLIAVGPQTNVAEALALEPRLPRMVRRLVFMGGSYRVGYGGSSVPCPEWNIYRDVAAAQAVAQSGMRMTMVPLDVTATFVPTEGDMQRLKGSPSPHAAALYELSVMYGERGGPFPPVLYDVMAILQAADPMTCRAERARISVDDAGNTVPVAGRPTMTVCTDTDYEAAMAAAWEVLGL